MGEYAVRKIDGKRVKIGTCEALYYLRYEQRNEVDYNFHNCEWYWRIPNPEEDFVLPGDFNCSPLHNGMYIPYPLKLKTYTMPEKIKQEYAESTGIVQLKNEKCGLFANVPCHHGLALPAGSEDIKFHWNGKSDCLYLAYLKNTERELRIVTECKVCGKMHSMTFDEIEPIMQSLWMKLRLLHLCTDYWNERNYEPCHYSVAEKVDDDYLEIYNISGEKDKWNVAISDRIIMDGTWEECRNCFISNLKVLDRNDPRFGNRDDYYYEVEEMQEHYLKSKASKEYRELKRDYSDFLLLFQRGMFYECYNDDALACQEVLGITPTNRGDVQVVGFPVQALDSYLPRLVMAGKRVAICEKKHEVKGDLNDTYVESKMEVTQL